MLVPHITGLCFVALAISLVSALQSSRLDSLAIASM